jgi:hypothetical protein
MKLLKTARVLSVATFPSVVEESRGASDVGLRLLRHGHIEEHA